MYAYVVNIVMTNIEGEDNSCDSSDDQTYGQFLIDLFDLWEIDLTRRRQPYIRQFENYISILMGQIPESCEQRGGCRRHRQQPGTAPGENCFCDSYRMFFEACLPRMQEIARQCMRQERGFPGGR